MINPRNVVLTFVAAVVAALVGWVGGGYLRDVVGIEHEVAVGVVDAQVGAAVTTASPTPVATIAPTMQSSSPSPTITPSASPTASASLGPCPGTPPRDNCRCRERKNNARWVCPFFDAGDTPAPPGDDD